MGQIVFKMMRKTFLQVNNLMAFIMFNMMMIFLQVKTFMEDPMTLVRMVIIFLLSLIFLLVMRLATKMMMGLGMNIMF